ncbi:DUF2345 domain-containing protein, partial [Paludibacterium sp.]|uniref:DUF2345 domain-containing protein n=1 Tax=Paludibacterium sp. TaxID=1917523 RepID=UPI0025F64487
VVLNADKEILLTSGGGYIRLVGGNIEVHCPGQVTIKGANHAMSGPASMSPSMPLLPQSEYRNTHSLRFASAHSDELAQDMGLVGKPYKIVDETGKVHASGFVPKNGRLPRVMTEEPQHLSLAVGEDKWKQQVLPHPAQEPTPTASEAAEDESEEEDLSNMPYVAALQEDGAPILSHEILQKILQG